MQVFNVSEFARRVGRSVSTLQRWDREGVLVPSRTPTGRRVYGEEHLRQALGVLGIETEPSKRRGVAYCRVSSAAQKPDLANQQRVLEQFCAARGLADVEWIAEVGGGLNFKRPRFVALMDAVSAREVQTLVVAHKDRLARFGFDWFAHHCEAHGCELLVMNQEILSPEREMVEDLMAIVHCFSSRLYGLRNYRKALREALKETP